jgi:hypothetical protein
MVKVENMLCLQKTKPGAIKGLYVLSTIKTRSTLIICVKV